MAGCPEYGRRMRYGERVRRREAVAWRQIRMKGNRIVRFARDVDVSRPVIYEPESAVI